MTLSSLRARLETATEADQGQVLEMAFDVFLPDPLNMPDCSDDYDQKWLPLVDRFAALMGVEAHTDAALLIMREVLPGWLCVSDENSCEVCDQMGDYHESATAKA
jgi:hypothetical protein